MFVFFFFMAREFDGFYSLFLLVESKESLIPEGGGGTPKWNGRGCSSSRLEGVKFGFWSLLGCSGNNVIIFSRQGLVKGCTRRNNKTERVFIFYIYSIHINWSHKRRPRPYWSLLGVKFKISDEHPRPLHVGVPPGSLSSW